MMKRHALIVAMVLLVASLQADAQTTWFKYEHNPVMSYGAPGSWESFSLLFQRVIRVGDTLKMWYGGEPALESNARIGYAWSTDGGIHWTKYASNPVLTVTQPWEGNTVYSPYVIFTGTEYKMWYTGYYGPGKIGYAKSTDGIHWTKSAANPVLTPGPSTWDAQSLSFPCVLADTTGFKMWYCGFNANYQRAQVGYATAKDETTWTKVQNANPVLTPGTWDGAFIRFQRILRDGQLYHIWYSGALGLSGGQCGHATSTDGMNWTRDSANPVMALGPSGSWDSQTIAMPEVLFDGAIYHMWYDAFDWGNVDRIGYAVSPKGFAVTVTPNRESVDRTKDTVRVRVRVDDPQGQSYWAVIRPKSGGTADTLRLFDDGLHGDSLAADGVFANRWIPGPQSQYTFSVKLKLYDTLAFSELSNVDSKLVTAVGNAEQGIPLSYMLGQNYPNPFNPSTQIKYTVGVASGRGQVASVKLVVYDLLGREVAVLVDEKKAVGSYEVTFDGSGLSSGTYFYRLTAGDYVATKKLLLLK